MNNIVIAAACIAVALFFLMHIVCKVKDMVDARRRRDDWIRTKKELDDEILHGGNLARIGQLRKRMRELE